jgi:amino acid transporter
MAQVKAGDLGLDHVFVRQSTGLVREASLLDAFAFNSLGMNVGVGLVLLLVQGMGFFPSGSVLLAIGIGTILLAFTSAWVYSEFAAAIPRSGGDYVFVSRVLHPVAGWLLSWNNGIWMAFYWIGFNAWFALTFAIPTSLSSITAATGQSFWQRIGTDITTQHKLLGFTTQWWVLLFGTVINVAFAALLIFGGRHYWRWQKGLFALAGASLLVCGLLMAFRGHAGVVSSWNSFAKRNHSLTYAQVIPAATKAGFTSGGLSLSQTLLLFPWVFFVVGFGSGTAQLGGEIKRASKNQYLSIVGGVIVNGLLMLLLAWAYLASTGTRWASALSYLSSNDPAKLNLPVQAGFNFFGSILTTDIPLLLIIGLGFILWALMGTPTSQLQATRYMLAWSLDRAAPSALSEVDDRRHTPVRAIVITTITGEIGLLALVTWSQASLLGALLAQVLALIVVCIAGVVFPYRHAGVWLSGGGKRIAGIPAIVAAGAAGVLVLGALLLAFIFNKTENTVFAVTRHISLYFMIAVLATGVLWYLGAALINRRRGVDIGLAFREIPPE